MCIYLSAWPLWHAAAVDRNALNFHLKSAERVTFINKGARSTRVEPRLLFRKQPPLEQSVIMYLLSGLFGAILGAAIARKRRGKGLDMAQYAAGYGILFALIGLILTIIVDRTVI